MAKQLHPIVTWLCRARDQIGHDFFALCFNLLFSQICGMAKGRRLQHKLHDGGPFKSCLFSHHYMKYVIHEDLDTEPMEPKRKHLNGVCRSGPLRWGFNLDAQENSNFNWRGRMFDS